MWGGPPPPGLTPEQMMQMMQMQMQMQQMAQQQTAAAFQPPAQPPAAPASAQFVKASIVLVRPASKDGDLELADGQRTSVPIKVELNDAQEPTGAYSTAQSVRHKAASSFPDAGECSWKLYVG